MAQAGAEANASEAESRRALTSAMDRHAEGDHAAFGELYDLLAPRLLAYFSRHLQGREHAEDLVQHTLLNMHRARAHFVRGSDVVPWAFAIGRRLLIDTQRRQKNEVLFENEEESRQALDSRVERGERPDELVAAQQLAERLQHEISRLSEPQRAAYALVRQDGLSIAEAAKVLGTTTGAVKLRAHRAYEALRAVLRETHHAVTNRRKSR